MEETIFRLPAVAGELKEGFIEARLHTDLIFAEGDRIRRLQKEFTKTISIPAFVLVDALTERRVGKVVGWRSGEKFLAFLRKASKLRGKSGN